LCTVVERYGSCHSTLQVLCPFFDLWIHELSENVRKTSHGIAAGMVARLTLWNGRIRAKEFHQHNQNFSLANGGHS
jgi:hypothetical protein